MTVLGGVAERVEQPEQMQIKLLRLLAAAQKVGPNDEADVRIEVQSDQVWQKEVDLVLIGLSQFADVAERGSQ